MRLEGKSAIITGGGSGIGLACAQLFYNEGAQVSIIGRRQERLEVAKKIIGSGLLTVVGNLKDNNDLDDLVSKTLNTFGKIDIVINNEACVHIKTFALKVYPDGICMPTEVGIFVKQSDVMAFTQGPGSR